MCKIFLVRPGQTDYDSQHRVQGSLNLPLNEGGFREVEALIESLADQEIDLILSGPNEPSHSTAEIISEKLDVPFKSSDLLRNVSQGIWEGLEVDEVKRKFPTVYRHWEDAPLEVAIPNAEPIEAAVKRVTKLMKQYGRKDKQILIVAPEPLATLIACNVEGRKVCLHHHPQDIKRCKLQTLHRA
ncbi:histidine phosphatase family protein [Rubinisphaera sp.]|uniref:histidine phosphatase family protein n=1 Tax=Rubinisphaera sp. TaxID=2024857 RepID=UPI000C0FA86F|nr:histidine phosphatase family protein [Rubinisphaera sp.]MBV09841.1 phosphoglycerate mutase [Rubinisphaera sp.]HCS50828.1 histidine phosphatase family protein [Planctomycetaceae bacterium]|tara:strand:- start:67 stop:621 length:555 start_codon:yes stop_codon:yes gene_type:complete